MHSLPFSAPENNPEQHPLFDYALLDTDTRTFVQEKAQAIHTRLKRTAEDIIAIGLDLIEVKACLGHGQFISWLETEFDLTRQSAANFMRVAERFGRAECKTVLHLPVRVLYELASPSTPDTVIEMVESGEIPATIPAIREAKQEVQREEAERILQREPAPAIHPTLLAYTPRSDTAEEMTGIHPTSVVSTPFVRPIDDIREQARLVAKERIASLKANGVDLPTGVYSCLVVDPPWTMQKIERDVRPHQVEFEYPTMNEDQLKAFPLPDFSAAHCHLYLWTTQKHVPLALRLAEHWGFTYQCLMTWVKNVGFTPFSWMYSTEHVLFCRKGNLPLLELGKRLDFGGEDVAIRAKVREHSRKPDEFYDLVRQVSPGPRLDVFSREKREGFDQFGNEIERFHEGVSDVYAR